MEAKACNWDSSEADPLQDIADARDAEKAQWAKENGYEFMAIWEHEIKERGAWSIIAQAFG